MMARLRKKDTVSANHKLIVSQQHETLPSFHFNTFVKPVFYWASILDQRTLPGPAFALFRYYPWLRPV